MYAVLFTKKEMQSDCVFTVYLPLGTNTLFQPEEQVMSKGCPRQINLFEAHV